MVKSSNPLSALVLEGGALRGLFSAGVMDVLMEQQISFDGIVGVSAGAAFGCNYKSHQAGRAIRYNKRFAHDWRFCSVRSWLTTGDLFGADFGYHYMPRHLDVFDEQTFGADPTHFFVVCTDVETGEPVYKELREANDEAYDWIRASASMPLAARIVEIGGRKLLDGGLADSIPLQFMQQQGYDRHLVVLTQPAGYEKRPNRLLPLIRLKYRKYPNFIATAARRHEMYNRQLAYVAQEEAAGRAIVIRPPKKLPIEHLSHNPETMDEVYQLGRKAAKERLEEIAQFVLSAMK